MKQNFIIMPWLFLVKVNKQEQRNFKERISTNSPFFMPLTSVHNTRYLECGEIVQIGEDVRGTSDYQEYINGHGIYGWEKCEVGMKLIFHHTIQSPVDSKGKEKHVRQYFLFEDETYDYYAVDNINLRGFYDGKTVTPHPNFVFLKNIPCFDNSEEVDSSGNKLKKSEGGLFLITNWEINPSNIAQKSQQIKEHIDSLAKSKRTDEIQREMEKLEQQRIELNRKAQKRMYLPYRVAHSNRRVDRDFGRKVQEDDVLYCFNKACLYISNFQDKEYSYIICLVEHIAALVDGQKLKPIVL